MAEFVAPGSADPGVPKNVSAGRDVVLRTQHDAQGWQPVLCRNAGGPGPDGAVAQALGAPLDGGGLFGTSTTRRRQAEISLRDSRSKLGPGHGHGHALGQWELDVLVTGCAHVRRQFFYSYCVRTTASRLERAKIWPAAELCAEILRRAGRGRELVTRGDREDRRGDRIPTTPGNWNTGSSAPMDRAG